MSKFARLFQVLTEYPDDYSRAAKETGMSRAEVKAYIDDPANGYQEVKDSYLDSLTSAYKNWVRGVKVIEDFNGAHALKILERERPEDWSTREKPKKPKVRHLLPPAKKSPLVPALSSIDFSPSFSSSLPDLPGPFEITDEDLKNLHLDINDEELEIEEL